ncbi:DUF4393 domain-containing protein [Eikenella sp. S3360]|uniref:DUF4393 domain-containing protein n=1 Tax=Eikenella glucosivorans TaxID=2766967 RepID=A0ABS0ND21_9NEIS|nr:DUF4393 domain-containing protein [Eikenella glucosivorans]MBH5330216.1 DUF4393 domain-containing protein [Eikenella glucosivorans]
MDATIITSVITAGATTLITKGAEAPAHTFNLIWKQVFGTIDNWLEKQEIKRRTEIEDFSRKINRELEDIPAENIQEPKMSILGPAMEAAQYYLEENELRKMFAKLVASSFDNRNNEIIHNGFVEKLKSLSSHDARLLKFIKENLNEIAVGEYYMTYLDGDLTLSDVICLAFGEENIKKNSISLDNLAHLGLIQVDLTRKYTMDEKYGEFYTTNLYFYLSKYNQINELKNSIQKQLQIMSKEELALSIGYSSDFIEDCLKERSVILRKGTCKLTSLGKTFVNICCE